MEPSAPPPLHLRLCQLSELTEEEGNIQILVVQRKSNGIVKGDAQGRVRILAALSAFEEVLLYVLENWCNDGLCVELGNESRDAGIALIC